MCNLGKPQVPRGWQQVCQKANMPVESRDPCSLFLSPNGKTFKTMDEVTSYSKILDQEKMAREQKKMAAKNLKLNVSDVPRRIVGNSTELGCTQCEKSFVNMVMLKKHYKEAHAGGSLTLSSEANSQQQSTGGEKTNATAPISAKSPDEQRLAQEKAKQSLMKLSGVAVSSKTGPAIKPTAPLPKLAPALGPSGPVKAAILNPAAIAAGSKLKASRPLVSLPPLARLPLSQACMQPKLLPLQAAPSLSLQANKQAPITASRQGPLVQTNKMAQQLKPQRPPGPQNRLPWLTSSFIRGPPRSAPSPSPSHRIPNSTLRPQRPPGPAQSSLGKPPALKLILLATPALQWLSTQNPILGMKCELLCFARK